MMTSLKFENIGTKFGGPDTKKTYLYSLINFIGSKSKTWVDKLSQEIDSKHFDFLDVAPIIEDPHQVLIHVSRVPLFIHMIAAIACMGLSSTYHLFKDHSLGYN